LLVFLLDLVFWSFRLDLDFQLVLVFLELWIWLVFSMDIGTLFSLVNFGSFGFSGSFGLVTLLLEQRCNGDFPFKSGFRPKQGFFRQMEKTSTRYEVLISISAALGAMYYSRVRLGLFLRHTNISLQWVYTPSYDEAKFCFENRCCLIRQRPMDPTQVRALRFQMPATK
jgi:hypothetical protein